LRPVTPILFEPPIYICPSLTSPVLPPVRIPFFFVPTFFLFFDTYSYSAPMQVPHFFNLPFFLRRLRWTLPPILSSRFYSSSSPLLTCALFPSRFYSEAFTFFFAFSVLGLFFFVSGSRTLFDWCYPPCVLPFPSFFPLCTCAFSFFVPFFYVASSPSAFSSTAIFSFFRADLLFLLAHKAIPPTRPRVHFYFSTFPVRLPCSTLQSLYHFCVPFGFWH